MISNETNIQCIKDHLTKDENINYRSPKLTCLTKWATTPVVLIYIFTVYNSKYW